MKVVFDTNVYISYIRNGLHSEELERRGTSKYIAGTVLMELWAGARTKRAERFLQKNFRPYIQPGRVVILRPEHYLSMGKFIADLPRQYDDLIKKASFMNDIRIAFSTLSIGATLFTEDRDHFEIIRSSLRALKVQYLLKQEPKDA